jgi:hypothetical protein
MHMFSWCGCRNIIYFLISSVPIVTMRFIFILEVWFCVSDNCQHLRIRHEGGNLDVMVTLYCCTRVIAGQLDVAALFIFPLSVFLSLLNWPFPSNPLMVFMWNWMQRLVLQQDVQRALRRFAKSSFWTYYYLIEFNLVWQSHLLVLALDYEFVNQTEASWKGGLWEKGGTNRWGWWGRGWEDCKMFSSWKLKSTLHPSVLQHIQFLSTYIAICLCFLLLGETQRHCRSYRDWQSKPGEAKGY